MSSSKCCGARIYAVLSPSGTQWFECGTCRKPVGPGCPNCSEKDAEIDQLNSEANAAYQKGYSRGIILGRIGHVSVEEVLKIVDKGEFIERGQFNAYWFKKLLLELLLRQPSSATEG